MPHILPCAAAVQGCVHFSKADASGAFDWADKAGRNVSEMLNEAVQGSVHFFGRARCSWCFDWTDKAGRNVAQVFAFELAVVQRDLTPLCDLRSK